VVQKTWNLCYKGINELSNESISQ